jgi:hypothetical protein
MAIKSIKKWPNYCSESLKRQTKQNRERSFKALNIVLEKFIVVGRRSGEEGKES